MFDAYIEDLAKQLEAGENKTKKVWVNLDDFFFLALLFLYSVAFCCAELRRRERGEWNCERAPCAATVRSRNCRDRVQVLLCEFVHFAINCSLDVLYCAFNVCFLLPIAHPSLVYSLYTSAVRVFLCTHLQSEFFSSHICSQSFSLYASAITVFLCTHLQWERGGSTDACASRNHVQGDQRGT